MEPVRDVDLRSPVAAFRSILIGVCGVLALLPEGGRRGLTILAGLSVLTWVVFRARMRDDQRVLVAYAEALIAGASVVASGGSDSPLLPYLLSPGLALGMLAGPRAVLQGAVLSGASIVVARAAGETDDPVRDLAVSGLQWVLLALAVGMVATWARRITTAPAGTPDRYGELRTLLEQLRTITRGLPGGLDAGAAAEALLDEAGRAAPNTRSAVLVQTVEGGALVPLAVRGTRRVPWRAPLSAPGPLRDAWESQQPVVDRRQPDRHGRRQGGALLAVPIVGSEALFGLVVLEAREPGAFPEERIAAVREVAAGAALRLETALLFDEVRSVATAEERNRLAREMHDGVAQDLAFIGYQLDELRGQADKVDTALGARVAELRKDLTGLISNLRLSITDLKTSVSADRGLGAALGSYIRAISTGRTLRVHLSLQESPFRLPSDREVALFQLAQVVAQDVRQAGRAENLWVTLTVDPPSARLVVEHDGGEEAHELGEVRSALERLDAILTVSPRRGGGVRVEAVFEGGDDGDPGAAGR